MAIVPMCRALQQRGIEVLVVATDAGLSDVTTSRIDETGQVTETARVVDYKGVPAIFFRSQFGESFKYSRPLAAWLDANAERFAVGHVHAVFNHSAVAATRAFHKAHVPYVIRPLGTLDPWSMEQKPLRKRIFWSLVGDKMMRRAAAVHYTSQREKTATETLLGVNHGQVIPLGIEIVADQVNGARDNGASNPYVLVMSRLHPKKGLDVLIDAFITLTQRAEFSQWQLVIAGDGPTDQVELLQQKAIAAGDRIIFTGWLDGERKEEILRNASLLVLPSYQENFGLCVMEALARSIPVLISPHVNLADEIERANAGWIAPVEPRALSETLGKALSSREELVRRGRAGKSLSLRFSWERVATDLAELYIGITPIRG
jgi:glycosyltransferase involved in cell wall biosynthesis